MALFYQVLGKIVLKNRFIQWEILKGSKVMKLLVKDQEAMNKKSNLILKDIL